MHHLLFGGNTQGRFCPKLRVQSAVANASIGLAPRRDSKIITTNILADHKVSVSRFGFSFSPKRYNAIDHGYATTIHKSQGATVDHAFVLGSRQMDRHLTYVSMSRHRESVKFYADSSSPLKLGDETIHFPKRARTWLYQ